MSAIPAPHGIAGSEHVGVRVSSIIAENAAQLAERVALVLGEHLVPDDKLPVIYNAVQAGWRHDPGRAGWRPRQPHTQVFFEHAALVVLRAAD